MIEKGSFQKFCVEDVQQELKNHSETYNNDLIENLYTRIRFLEPQEKKLCEDTIMNYILDKMPCEAVTDMLHKLSCLRQFMGYLDQSAVFSFCLKTRDRALKDVQVYSLFYSVFDMCIASLETWSKELSNSQKHKAVILEFERLLDAYLYLSTQESSNAIGELIKSNRNIENKAFSLRIQLFNTIHFSEVLPLQVPNLESEPLLSIQKTLNELERSQFLTFELEINLIENCLWNKETETKFPSSFCVLKKSSHSNLNEIVSFLHLADLSAIVKMSACLLCLLSEENSKDFSSIKDTVEIAWARLYAKLLEDIVFENTPCCQSLSGQILFKAAACLVAYRGRFGLANISLFKRVWSHFHLQRSIYLKSITNAEDLKRAQKDMSLLENAVFVSVSSPIHIS